MSTADSTIQARVLPRGITVPSGVSIASPRDELRKLRSVTEEELQRTYHGAAIYSHYFYDTVGIFSRLVNRMVDTANTEMTYHFRSDDDDERNRHKDLARWWCENINQDIALSSNESQGAFPINGAGIFNGFLEGMLTTHWRRQLVSREKQPGAGRVHVYPDFPLDGVYELPMRISVLSAVNVRLERLKVTLTGRPRLSDGNLVKGTDVDDPEFLLVVVDEQEWERMGRDRNASSVYVFCENRNDFFGRDEKVIAYPWDQTSAWKFMPRYNVSAYPTLPTQPMFPVLEELKAIETMDQTTIQSFIRQMLLIKCGTEWRPTIPDKRDDNGKLLEAGDLQNAARALNQLSRIGGLIFPGHWDIDILKQADADLLGFDKFVAPLMKLFVSMGIMVSYSRTGDMSDSEVSFNIQGFRDLLEGFRTRGRVRGMRGFWQQLWRNEVTGREVNSRRGIRLPLSIGFEPMTLNVSQFIGGLFDAHMQGLVSKAYLLEALGVDAQTQKAMVEEEGDAFGEARISYKQAAVKPGGDETVSDLTRNQQRGRPPKRRGDTNAEDVL